MEMSGRERSEARSIGEQAAEWLLALEEQGSGAHEAFADWLAKSPLNIEAFLKASAMDTLLTRVDPQHTYAVENAGRTVVPDIQSTVVAEPSTKRMRRPQARSLWLAAACLAFVAIAGLGLWKAVGVAWPGSDFSTDIGEQRVLELEDGSVLYLNTSSRVHVAFSERERRVDLLRGEALFRVQHQASRPFRVHGRTSIVEAVGTQFNVRLREDDALVSVIEGAVRVSTAAVGRQPSDSLEVKAGLQVRVNGSGAIAHPENADVKRVEAWRHRRLIFVDQPLFEIASEFNRYNRTPKIFVAGEVAGTRRYAAAFDADDPESLLEILRSDPALWVERDAEEIVIRGR